MSYRYNKELDIEFEEVVKKTRKELSKQGFGIITEIDVKETLKKKLNIDYDNYIILGACNPSLAYKALQAEKEIGLLLPCNVIIYQKNKKTIISAINPTEAMSIIDNNSLKEIAEEVAGRLKKLIEIL